MLSAGSGEVSRSYVFTDWSGAEWREYDWRRMGARYAVGQVEEGEGGRRHMQGYVELQGTQRLERVKQQFPRGGAKVWLEGRRGTAGEARAYCMKAETRVSGPWEWGTFTERGRGRVAARKGGMDMVRDAELVRRLMLEEGWSREDVFMQYAHFANMQHRVIAECERIQERRAGEAGGRERVRVVAIQGEAGTGKSTTVRGLLGAGEAYYQSADSGGWYCGYAGERVLVYEELTREMLSLSKFKQCADGGEYQLRRKNRPGVRLTSELLVLISNGRFGQIWRELEESAVELEAVRRRVDVWCKYTRGLPPYEGFSVVRLRFQDVSRPGGEQVGWLGLYYPYWGGGGVSFEECLERSGVREWAGEARVHVRAWALMTLRVLEACMRTGELSAGVRELLEATPAGVRRHQATYELAEGQRERTGVYAEGYDLVPAREGGVVAAGGQGAGGVVVNYAEYRGLENAEFLAAVQESVQINGK